MDRMLVVVFDNEGKAYEGKKALLALDSEGSINVYAYAVLAKQANGTATVKQGDDPGPIGTVLATSLGAVVGLLGGPAASVVGATAGASLGAGFDINNARIGSDFIDDVTKVLTPKKFALVAEVDEDWTTPVDTRMESIGGTVFRRALSDVTDTVNREEVAAMKADVAQLKAELAQARSDRKAKLQSMINDLDTKIQVKVQKGKEKRDAAEQQAHAKAQVLKKKAAAAGRAVKDLANTPI
jgi:uncharacterized membrane protein